MSQVVGPDTGEQSPEEGRGIKKNENVDLFWQSLSNVLIDHIKLIIC